jgi:hypothetical protein
MGDRSPPRVEAGVGIHAIEPPRRLPHDGGEHDIGFTPGNVSDNRLEVVVPRDHRHVFLSDHLAAAALHQIAHDPI